MDLLAQGDCLCLTFEVDRPKGGLIDPLLFSVLNVNECLLGADVFMNSALFLGKVGMIIEGNSRYT